MLYDPLETILWQLEHYHETPETDSTEEHERELSFLLMVGVLLIFLLKTA
jgi:hypothetical protein